MPPKSLDSSATTLKVALVHDWLVGYRGGERVLEAIGEIYPEAPIFTLFYDPKSMPQSINNHPIVVPALLNMFKPMRKLLLPILPRMIAKISLQEFDLVISTSSCVAKACIPAPRAKHLSYVHSPMRYIWDQREYYFSGIQKIPVLKQLVDVMITRLRHWDSNSNDLVTQFIANSTFIAHRIKRFYKRSSKVIFPPVDINSFMNDPVLMNKRTYFLAAGAFVPYKRFDLTIKAFLGRPEKLIIAGSGPLEGHLRSLASGASNITFEISPPHSRWVQLMQNAKALVFPCVEDFGITSIEAMAAGTPVIACNQGGAVDYVIDKQTGCFITPDDLQGLIQVIDNFDKIQFDPLFIQRHAQRFSKQNFLDNIRREIDELLKQPV